MEKLNCLKSIGCPTPGVEDFLGQWNDGSDSIEAHTSGSTGLPKRIQLRKSDMALSARNTISFFELGPDSLLALPLSTAYIAGKMMVVRALLAGAFLYSEAPGNQVFRNFPAPHRTIDLAAIVPSQIDGLLACGIPTRRVIVGGAPLSEAQEQKLIASGIKAYATYGMTETCSHVALRRLGELNYKALPGIQFDVDDRGCLVIVARGYSFGRMKTNDVVRLLDPTTFQWLGRADNVINSGGIKIHPEELERELGPLLPGLNFYITSCRSDRWGETVALVLETDEIPADIDTRFVPIDRYRRPKKIICRSQFERTESGKVKREKFL